jgi:tetratricopeptide (TPR) repeat protein
MAAITPARWAELSPHLDELLTLPPLERAQRLDELAANDARTAADLRELLASREGASRVAFLGGVAQETLLPAHVRAGDALGPWTLVQGIGEGGMGTVWRARRSDGRYEGEAAIKLLKSGLFDSGAQERFRREGAILARLKHPGIAQLLDAGITAQGQPYLVLELVQGQRIDRWCEARGLGLRQRVDLFAQVLDAVQTAHALGVVHRDLKPSNILVADDGRVKLLDFGIARLLPGAEAELTALTREGSLALTPEYAAPEQFEGGVLSVATDVYALGIVLFDLLAAAHPSGLAPGAGAMQYMQAALQGQAARASAVAPVAQRKALRGDLDNILAKALRLQPTERYASVAALADDLRAHLAYRPVAARPDALLYRLGRFVRRHRVGTALGALALVAAMAGVAGTVVQGRRAQAERDTALRDLAFATGSGEVLQALISSSSEKPMNAAALLARTEEIAQARFAGDPETRARVLLAVGIQMGNAMDSGHSLRVLGNAQSAAVQAGRPALAANIQCLVAATLGDMGQREAALASFAQVLQRLRDESIDEPSVLGVCLKSRADLHAASGQPQAMLDDAEAAITALGRAGSTDAKQLSSARVSRAEALSRLGRLPESLQAYERALADHAELGNLKTAEGSVRQSNFGQVLYRAGRMQRAAQVLGQAHATAMALGPSLPQGSIIEGFLARAYVEIGRGDEARGLFEHALAQARERKDTRWTGIFAVYAARPWCEAGDLARCTALLDEADIQLHAGMPKTHPILAFLQQERARLALDRKDPAAARALFLQAVDGYAAASEPSPQHSRTLALLAQTELQQGDGPAALRHAEQAVSQARAGQSGVPGSLWLGLALLAQGQVLQQTGAAAQALPLLREAVAELETSVGAAAPATQQAQSLLAAR